MNPTRFRFAILVWCAIGTAPALCVAQGAPVYPPPGSQQQPAPMYGTPPYYAEPGSESRGRMRQFFANSLAVLMQGSGVSTSAGLSEMVVGGIADWFERRKRRKQNRAPSAANGDQHPRGDVGHQHAAPGLTAAASSRECLGGG